MGGNADRSGYVRKETIINIIKNEFELSYNMEAFTNISSQAATASTTFVPKISGGTIRKH